MIRARPGYRNGGSIFAGVVVLIVGIVEKAGELDGEPRRKPRASRKRIALPTGAIVETHLDGDRILVRLKLVMAARLIVVSAATGKQTGTIN